MSRKQKPILILDPGHGGRDFGGGSNTYWLEKDLNLTISLYQLERLRALGIPTTITRDADVNLSPLRRTKVVKESGATYCISNHINAGGGDGFEAIHSIYSDGELANQIAEQIKVVGQNVRRVFEREYPNKPNEDYYYMHRETGQVETVIVEYGFADSKKDDVGQLQENWKQYAEAVVKGFCQYIGHPYIEELDNHKEENADSIYIKEIIALKRQNNQLKEKLIKINKLSE